MPSTVIDRTITTDQIAAIVSAHIEDTNNPIPVVATVVNSWAFFPSGVSSDVLYDSRYDTTVIRVDFPALTQDIADGLASRGDAALATAFQDAAKDVEIKYTGKHQYHLTVPDSVPNLSLRVPLPTTVSAHIDAATTYAGTVAIRIHNEQPAEELGLDIERIERDGDQTRTTGWLRINRGVHQCHEIDTLTYTALIRNAASPLAPRIRLSLVIPDPNDPTVKQYSLALPPPWGRLPELSEEDMVWFIDQLAFGINNLFCRHKVTVPVNYGPQAGSQIHLDVDRILTRLLTTYRKLQWLWTHRMSATFTANLDPTGEDTITFVVTASDGTTYSFTPSVTALATANRVARTFAARRASAPSATPETWVDGLGVCTQTKNGTFALEVTTDDQTLTLVDTSHTLTGN